MEAIHNINLASLLDSVISVATAFIFGAIIGSERQYRQRTAGLRTNVLVAIGASVFVDMANRLDGHSGAVRVVSYVVSGIGFLGAGVIMREQGNVRGLNTAATLWGSAAVGACCGADMILEALVGTIFVLIANTSLRPLVNVINRQPFRGPTVEATTTIYAIVDRAHQKEGLALLREELAAANCPANDVKIHSFGPAEVEIEATLAAVSIDDQVLDDLTTRLVGAHNVINRAFWSPSTME